MALCNETAKDQFLVRVLTAVGLLVEGDVSVGADDERDMGLHQSEPLPSGKVTVKLVTAIVSPAVMLVVFKIMSAELVPQVPCHSTVPPPFVEETRKWPAVPLLAALVSDVMAFAVAVMMPVDTPSTAGLMNAVEPNFGAARWVPASLAPQEAGIAPVQMLM